jgi:hypothetical protein
MQASEACQHEQTILNGIEAMGNNIAKVISSEIQAMSACVDVLNQALLDAIMKRLNVSNHAKENPNLPTVDYTTTMSESPSMSNSNPTPSWPKDEEESKHSPPMPTPPKRSGPKCPPFPTPGPTSRGHPRRPDPGGSGGSGRRPPAGGDPGDDLDPDDNPSPDHNPETD